MSVKIITFANHKGGVSKTTSTASIGACMARMGKKVLLIYVHRKVQPPKVEQGGGASREISL